MTYVTPTLPSPGDTADASDISTPIQQIVAVINGNLDDSNISGLSGSKLANGTTLLAKINGGTTAGTLQTDASGNVTVAPGVWQSWTPTCTNLTVGAGGVVVAKYTQIGKTVHFRLWFALGTSPSVGDFRFTLPVTSVAYVGTASLQIIGLGGIFDNGTAVFDVFVKWLSTTTAAFGVSNTAGTYATSTGISATVPMTWVATDELHVTGFYEAA
jgi:hypothetical protein